MKFAICPEESDKMRKPVVEYLFAQIKVSLSMGVIVHSISKSIFCCPYKELSIMEGQTKWRISTSTYILCLPLDLELKFIIRGWRMRMKLTRNKILVKENRIWNEIKRKNSRPISPSKRFFRYLSHSWNCFLFILNAIGYCHARHYSNSQSREMKRTEQI